MTADLDTLLTALYVELTDRIIPFRGPCPPGPGRPPDVTDAELACLAVAQVLLRCDDERHWLRAAPRLVGHLFPRLLAHSEYNTRLRQLAPLIEAALRWLADATPATAELLRLMDATPVPCGTSVVTDKGPVRAGHRGILRRRRPPPGPDPPRPQRREAAPPVPELAPPARRGRHLDPEKPARPRTPRRPHPRRTLGPHHPAAPRPQRLHLAQLADRRPRQAIPDRVRPRLTCPHFPINDPGRLRLIPPRLWAGLVCSCR